MWNISTTALKLKAPNGQPLHLEHSISQVHFSSINIGILTVSSIMVGNTRMNVI